MAPPGFIITLLKIRGYPIAIRDLLSYLRNYFLLLMRSQILLRHSTKNYTKINPDIRILLTVSPVRHTKDTLALNSVSKASLRVACHTIINRFKQVDYFPSYEIMMDDLRDYRFYDRDMIHPTAEAFDYISQKFSDHYFPAGVTSFIEKWKILKQALHHKPYQPHSSQHQLFLKELLIKLKAISEVSVDEEIKLVQSQIVNNV
jgi:hypothetical protein